MLPHRIFKANDNLKDIKINHVTCDCLPPVGENEIRHCENDSGEEILVDKFRQDNCYQNLDQNQTDITTPVFQGLNLNCAMDEDETFENFIWINPMGAIRFQSMVQS